MSERRRRGLHLPGSLLRALLVGQREGVGLAERRRGAVTLCVRIALVELLSTG